MNHEAKTDGKTAIFLGIRAKMLLFFGFGSALVLFSVSFINLFGIPFAGIKGSFQAHRSEIIQRIEEVADLKKREISHWFEERINHARAFSEEHGLDAVIARFSNGVAQGEDRKALLAGIRSLEEYRTAANHIRSMLSVYDEYEDIRIADIKTGIVIFSTDEERIGMDSSEEAAIKHAAMPGVGEQIYFKKDKGNVQLCILYPIAAGSRPGEDGMPSLATLFIVNPEKLFKQILHADTELGQSEEILLVDRNMTILSPLKYPLAGNKEAAPLEHRVDSKSAELAALGIDGIVFGKDYIGVPVIAAVRHIRLTSDFGLGMIANINEGEILADAWQSLKHSLLFSGLGLLLLLLLVHLFSGRITHPVIRLRRTAEKIMEGDLSARASVKTKDEVGYLAASFNAMAEEIQQWNQELESKVRERTAELSLELTERRRAEAALRESEREFRSLAEAMPQIVWATRPDGWNIYFNQQWVDYTGLTLEESYGHGWNKPFHPEDQQRAWDAWQRATQHNEEYSLECRLRRYDGTYRWWLIRGVPLIGKSGEILKWFGTCTDIEDIKRAEEKLQRSEHNLAEAERIGRTGSWDYDVDTDTASWSENMFRIFDVDTTIPRELVFKHFVENIVHPSDRTHILSVFQDALVGTRPYDLEYRIIKRDGGVRYVHALAETLRDEQDNVVRMIGKVEDITERKQVEEELQKYRDNLEVLVKERTNELEEAQAALVSMVEDLNEKSVQLAQAMEQVQSADRLKSAFLATMSHELRTPLNSIIGFTGIVLQGMSGPLSEEQAKQLAMVKGSANHLLILINDVLDISRIEAGQVQIARKSFDMRSVIEAALRSVMPQAAKKGLSLDCVIASDVGVMISDQRRVEQILINLVNNAVKFTERGAVAIECRTREGRLETCVRDTGIGIKAEDMGRLFIPFSQIDTGLTRSHEGSGLGLSICGKLVEMLGGTIRVESEWGKGSKFIFTLPLS